MNDLNSLRVTICTTPASPSWKRVDQVHGVSDHLDDLVHTVDVQGALLEVPLALDDLPTGYACTSPFVTRY